MVFSASQVVVIAFVTQNGQIPCQQIIIETMIVPAWYNKCSVADSFSLHFIAGGIVFCLLDFVINFIQCYVALFFLIRDSHIKCIYNE